MTTAEQEWRNRLVGIAKAYVGGDPGPLGLVAQRVACMEAENEMLRETVGDSESGTEAETETDEARIAGPVVEAVPLTG